VIVDLGNIIMRSQKGWGKKVAIEKAVWIGSDDTDASANKVVTEAEITSDSSGTGTIRRSIREDS
jgi:hypothetical protein